jgi:hypothetical protein
MEELLFRRGTKLNIAAESQFKFHPQNRETKFNDHPLDL